MTGDRSTEPGRTFHAPTRRLLCLNQFVPPDEAPTARLLAELATGLQAAGWEVKCLGAAAGYRKGKAHGWRRWLAELGAHARILWRGWRAARPDVILCLSDPPCLPVTAAVLAGFRRVPLVHWAMDVYPEIAASLGEVRRASAVFRLTQWAMRRACSRCALIGCLDEDMAGVLEVERDERLLLCAPWPPPLTEPAPDPTAPAVPESGRLRWLYSGNLGRAHDYETLLEAQRLLEAQGTPCELVFQGGGPCRAAAMQRARELGLQHCRWEDYASDAALVPALLRAQVLVASQKTEARGLLWPSKLALLRLLPRPIAWVGPVDGAIARSLRQSRPQDGIFAPGHAAPLADWLRERAASFKRAAGEADCWPQGLAESLEAARRSGIERWRIRLESLIARSA